MVRRFRATTGSSVLGAGPAGVSTRGDGGHVMLLPLRGFRALRGPYETVLTGRRGQKSLGRLPEASHLAPCTARTRGSPHGPRSRRSHQRRGVRRRSGPRVPLVVGPAPHQPGARSRAAPGCEMWDHDGNRWLDFSSQLVNLNLGHQHPKVIAAIVEQAERLCTVAPVVRQPDPQRSRPPDRRPHARRPRSGVLHQRRGGGQRERHPHGPRPHRSRQGAGHLPQLPRRHRRHDGPHRRAAPMGVASRPSRAWSTSSGRTRTARRSAPPPTRRRPTGAIAHLAEVIQYEGPERIAAIILETIVGTNGVLLPPADYLPRVRELCDAHGILLILDEVMVGLRSHRRLVRRRPLAGRARPALPSPRASTRATCRSVGW